MKLYGYWRSGATWRVRIALAWKGIAYEYQPVNLLEGKQHDEPYKALNLMQSVPLLEWHEGEAVRRLAQSLAILDHLEQRYPSPPLLPTDPWLRARARQLAEMVNSGIQPFQTPAVLGQVKALGGEEKPWVEFFYRRGLTALEEETSRTAGRFSVGDAPSFADCCLVPQLYACRRWKFDLSPFPTLTRIEAACEALPAFQAAHPDRQADAVHAPR
ncbi:MAG TPA: maleylacetoacetate isomerase [Myxococcaceae bacterium]|nr:maleylacetoacetate isomerase [Myxococcaceae bacterium]